VPRRTACLQPQNCMHRAARDLTRVLRQHLRAGTERDPPSDHAGSTHGPSQDVNRGPGPQLRGRMPFMVPHGARAPRVASHPSMPQGLASKDWTSKSDPIGVIFAVGDTGAETVSAAGEPQRCRSRGVAASRALPLGGASRSFD